MQFLKDADWRADHTDALAQRYLDAGFVCVGRTNTPELGLVPTTEPEAYGPTRNPWDTSRTPGGSSGGSAAAVASGMVAVAHANDGGGSIRIPASCCGLVGLKPSRGRTSLGPDYTAIDDMLVVELCVSRSVRDTAGVLDALHGRTDGETVSAPAPARPFTQEVGADPGKLRIGLLTHNPLDTGEIHPDCVAAARDTAQLLESLGHTVEETYPAGGRAARARRPLHDALGGHARLQHSLLGAEGRPRSTADEMEPLTWALAEMGRATSAPDYVDAQHAMGDLAREHRGVVRVGLRPAAHADARRAAVPARRVHDARRAVPRVHARRDLRSVHAAREHGRLARDLAAALVERPGPADRLAC